MPPYDLVATLPGVVWEADVGAQRMTFVSPQARDLMGYDPRMWVAEPGFLEMHIHPGDLAGAALAIEHTVGSGDPALVEYRFRCADGSYRWFQDAIRVVHGHADGSRLVGVMVDTTERHRTHDPLEMARPHETSGAGYSGSVTSRLHGMVVDNLADGVLYTDADRRITYWNRGAARLTGRPANLVLGHHCYDDRLSCVDAEGSSQCETCPITTALTKGWERDQPLWVRHASGQWVPMALRAYPIRNPSGGRVPGAVATFVELRNALAAGADPVGTTADSCMDPATSLPERQLIGAVVGVCKDELDRHGLPFGLALVEVDGLARIGAERGAEVATQVLRGVAGRIRGTLRAGDVMVRWSPTEFAIAASMTDARGMALMAERLGRLVRGTPTLTGAGPIAATISVGVSLARRGEPLGGLYARGELALSQARAQGGGGVVIAGPVAAPTGNRTLGVASPRTLAARSGRTEPAQGPG